MLAPPRADERAAIDDGDRPRARRVAGDRGRRFRARDAAAAHRRRREAMSLKCGIVGLAQRRQVDALQCADARRASPPRTIRSARSSPTSASSRCPIRASRALAAIAHPEKVLPATVEFVDIAGLVAGASKGEGLGNQFLANIRETDAIAHVVRCFEDDNVVHVAGKIDPDLRHRDDQHRAGARRSRGRRRSRSRSTKSPRAPATRKRSGSSRC